MKAKKKLNSNKAVAPDVVRGGTAIPISRDKNLYYMQGRKHEAGGIDVGKDAKTGIEVEGGEVMHLNKNGAKIFSAQPILNGESPAKKVLNGANPNAVFNQQERFKKANKINDDGSRKYQKGGKSNGDTDDAINAHYNKIDNQIRTNMSYPANRRAIKQVVEADPLELDALSPDRAVVLKATKKYFTDNPTLYKNLDKLNARARSPRIPKLPYIAAAEDAELTGFRRKYALGGNAEFRPRFAAGGPVNTNPKIAAYEAAIKEYKAIMGRLDKAKTPAKIAELTDKAKVAYDKYVTTSKALPRDYTKNVALKQRPLAPPEGYTPSSPAVPKTPATPTVPKPVPAANTFNPNVAVGNAERLAAQSAVETEGDGTYEKNVYENGRRIKEEHIKGSEGKVRKVYTNHPVTDPVEKAIAKTAEKNAKITAKAADAGQRVAKRFNYNAAWDRAANAAGRIKGPLMKYGPRTLKGALKGGGTLSLAVGLAELAEAGLVLGTGNNLLGHIQTGADYVQGRITGNGSSARSRAAEDYAKEADKSDDRLRQLADPKNWKSNSEYVQVWQALAKKELIDRAIKAENTNKPIETKSETPKSDTPFDSIDYKRRKDEAAELTVEQLGTLVDYLKDNDEAELAAMKQAVLEEVKNRGLEIPNDTTTKENSNPTPNKGGDYFSAAAEAAADSATAAATKAAMRTEIQESSDENLLNIITDSSIGAEHQLYKDMVNEEISKRGLTIPTKSGRDVSGEVADSSDVVPKISAPVDTPAVARRDTPTVNRVDSPMVARTDTPTIAARDSFPSIAQRDSFALPADTFATLTGNTAPILSTDSSAVASADSSNVVRPVITPATTSATPSTATPSTTTPAASINPARTPTLSAVQTEGPSIVSPAAPSTKAAASRSSARATSTKTTTPKATTPKTTDSYPFNVPGGDALTPAQRAKIPGYKYPWKEYNQPAAYPPLTTKPDYPTTYEGSRPQITASRSTQQPYKPFAVGAETPAANNANFNIFTKSGLNTAVKGVGEGVGIAARGVGNAAKAVGKGIGKGAKAVDKALAKANIKYEDLVGLSGNVAGSIIAYNANKSTLNKMQAPSAPIAQQATKLKTRININPQIDKMRESVNAYTREVNNNTASSRIALARNNQARLAANMQNNELYANKENAETQLINQDRLNQQSVAGSNIAAYNAYKDRLNEFNNARLEKQSENTIGLISGLNSSLQDAISRREQRRQFDKNVEILENRSPNSKELMSDVISSDANKSSGAATTVATTSTTPTSTPAVNPKPAATTRPVNSSTGEGTRPITTTTSTPAATTRSAVTTPSIARVQTGTPSIASPTPTADATVGPTPRTREDLNRDLARYGLTPSGDTELDIARYRNARSDAMVAARKAKKQNNT
jgi:hypothetical protein